jgi:putative hydrolase of HD superfamily
MVSGENTLCEVYNGSGIKDHYPGGYSVTADKTRLEKQIEFLETLDQLKNVFRANSIMDGSRRENSAEHSWHIAVMAMFLSEYAAEEIDTEKVIKMLLIHDVIEIDAGDTFCYDEEGYKDKAEREQRAAVRLFGLLPEDQGREFRKLWDEFEEESTAESRFANSMDRFQVIFQNYRNNGGTWVLHDVPLSSVLKRQEPIKKGAPLLWDTVEEVLRRSCTEGFLRDDLTGE